MNKQTINLQILLNNISEKLRNFSDKNESNLQNAIWILEAITKKTQQELFSNDEIILTNQQIEKLKKWLEKIINEDMPIQYLLASVPFNDLEILVQPPILIPRQETEWWSNELINKLNLLNNKKINILDIGTGTGCIALSMAKAFPKSQIYAVDISKDALSLAKKNKKHNKIKNVKLIESNLFGSLNDKKNFFDIIISNPPYLNAKEYKNLDASVKNWEDKKALFSTGNGLNLIKKIINNSTKFLKYNEEFSKKNIPQLILEIDSSRSNEVKNLLEQKKFQNIQIIKDLQKRDRVVYAQPNFDQCRFK